MQTHTRALALKKKEPNWGAHQGVAVTTTVGLVSPGGFSWLQRYTTWTVLDVDSLTH